MFPPALPPPLHAGHQREQNGRQTSRPVVVDQVSSVESDQAPREHNQPPEEVDVRVVLVREPLGDEAPAYSEGKSNDNLNRSVHCQFHRVGVLVECNSEKYSKPTDGHHVICSTSGDDQGWNSFSYAVTSGNTTFQKEDLEDLEDVPLCRAQSSLK